jgi:hypothetical protein
MEKRMWVVNTNIQWGDKKNKDMFIVNELQDLDMSEVYCSECQLISKHLDNDEGNLSTCFKLGADRFGRFPTILAAELVPGNFPKLKKYHFVSGEWIARDDKATLEALWNEALNASASVSDEEQNELAYNDVVETFTGRWTKSTTGRAGHSVEFLQECIALYKRHPKPFVTEYSISPRQFGDVYNGDAWISVKEYKANYGDKKTKKSLYDTVLTVGHEIYTSAENAVNSASKYGKNPSVDEFANIIFKNFPEARDILESHGVLDYSDFQARETALEQMEELGAYKSDEEIVNIYRNQLAQIGQA